jgi:hypothetical protein
MYSGWRSPSPVEAFPEADQHFFRHYSYYPQ